MAANHDDQTVFSIARISWPLQVIGYSTLVFCALVAMAIYLPHFFRPRGISMPDVKTASFILFAAAIFIVAWLMNPRRLLITRERIVIDRFLLPVSLPLDSISEARVQEDAMKSSIRVMGNGGFFAWVGWFYKKDLGLYRAYVTDRTKTVVFRSGKRNFVVSPADPEAFVERLKSYV